MPSSMLRGRRRRSFTTISNGALQNDSLSLEALGLLVHMLSRPPDWVFYKSQARERFGVGREKLDRILKELKDAGHVRQAQERDAGGRVGKSVYIFTEDPGEFDEDEPLPEKPYHGASPQPEKPDHGKPSHGKPAPTKERRTYKRQNLKSAPRISNFPLQKAAPAAIVEPSPEERAKVGRLVNDFLATRKIPR